MERILKDIQVLVCERLIGTATDAQIKEIEKSIEELRGITSSLPDKAGDAGDFYKPSLEML